jgi:hypothetical protein
MFLSHFLFPQQSRAGFLTEKLEIPARKRQAWERGIEFPDRWYRGKKITRVCHAPQMRLLSASYPRQLSSGNLRTRIRCSRIQEFLQAGQKWKKTANCFNNKNIVHIRRHYHRSKSRSERFGFCGPFETGGGDGVVWIRSSLYIIF